MKYNLLFIFVLSFVACSNKQTQPPEAIINVYLQDDVMPDTTSDIMFLQTFPHVNKVEFVSKEEAKKAYMEDGNQDWSEVLDRNPLPQSYSITVDARVYTKEEFEDMRSYVMKRIPYVTDVTYPQALFDE